MGMNAEIKALVASLNHHRKHLPNAIITLMVHLVETDKQPDESEEDLLYRAERKLKRDIGDEEFYRRN